MSKLQLTTPEFVTHILEVMVEHHKQIYIVGGAVRDLFLKRPVKDWDFTTDATPEEILQIFPSAFYNNTFGTVGIINPEDEALHQHGKLERIPVYEITTFRTERGYSDSRRPDQVEWGSSIEEDLQRRDFTISAMALKPEGKQTGSFELIDLYGGKQDLDQKIIRAVGSPEQRFQEDALRMLRAVRFAAQLGFSIETETLTAIQHQAHTLQNIANERIRDEFFKILTSQYAAEAITLLLNANLLQYIVPEIIATREVEQSGHHTDDVWTHSLNSLQNCPSKDPVVRLATLIHDVGKPATRAYICPHCQKYFKHKTSSEIISPPQVTCEFCSKTFDYRDGVVFHNHEVAGARIAKRIGQRLRLSNQETERLVILARYHMFTVDERQTDKAIRRFIRNVGKENLQDILDLRVGDRLGGGARETSWRLEEFKQRLIEVQKQPFTVRDLNISGHQVMEVLDIPPSPQIGDILDQLFNQVVENKIQNTEDALINALHSLKK